MKKEYGTGWTLEDLNAQRQAKWDTVSRLTGKPAVDAPPVTESGSAEPWPRVTVEGREYWRIDGVNTVSSAAVGSFGGVPVYVDPFVPTYSGMTTTPGLAAWPGGGGISMSGMITTTTMPSTAPPGETDVLRSFVENLTAVFDVNLSEVSESVRELLGLVDRIPGTGAKRSTPEEPEPELPGRFRNLEFGV